MSYNKKRNEKFKNKSVRDLTEIAKRGTLSSACAMHWLAIKAGRKNDEED